MAERMIYKGIAHGGQVAYECEKCSHRVLGSPFWEVLHCSKCIVLEARKWDYRWLANARQISSFSKDPSTKCGAVIIGPDNDLVSIGYNGFARGVKDSSERYLDRAVKLSLVVHAEVNAILFADRLRLRGSTLYTWPFAPCSNCAGLVIQAGIKRVVAPPMPPDKAARWATSMNLAATQFEEAGVSLVELAATD